MNSTKGVYARRPCSSEHKGVWRRTHKRKSGELVTSFVGEVSVQGHPKRTKSFSSAKYADPEREAALWYNRQVSELVGGGIARLNDVSGSDADGEEHDVVSSVSDAYEHATQQ